MSIWTLRGHLTCEMDNCERNLHLFPGDPPTVTNLTRHNS
jgi:hypothetical protein